MSRKGPAVSPARRAAWSVLLAAAEKGTRLEEALARRLEGVEMDRRDRALAAELAYGVSRWQGYLDYVIARFSKRRLDRISPEVLALLRLGAYQLLKLDRIPDRAAVHATVELAKARLNKWTAGFVNGVLRAVAERGRTVEPPERDEDLAAHLAVAHSHPRWLVERWLAELGPEATEALARADNARPELTLRANLLAGDRDGLIDRLRRAGLEARAGRYSPQAVVAPGGVAAEIETLAPGRFTPQSEASQLVSLALAPRPGWRVLDICAGAGGKSGHLAELMGDEGEVVALDRDEGRVEAGRQAVRRLGYTSLRYCRADALERLPGELEGEYDAVLVDAPCTGLGTLRSRPDRRWRVEPGDPARLAGLQLRLLEAAAGRVKPGGVLVYAVCTMTAEETTRVAASFLAARPEFEPADLKAVLPPPAQGLAGEDGFVVTWPHRHHLDGFFIARLIRRGG